MPEAEFEKTFADLAHARLRDRAPGLLDYLVGFQLLDKNDDDTHAVGVWGFKLGDEWLYAPVFFLNGQLKGDELLYLKSQDAFVPLKENWVNYLLNRRPAVLGEAEPREQSELGIQQPDFNAFARPPYAGSKYSSTTNLRGFIDYLSSTINDDFRPFLPVVMSSPSSDKRASLKTKFDLVNFVKHAGAKAARVLLNTMKKEAAFTDGVLRFYRIEDIISAAKEAFASSPTVKQAADGDTQIEGTAPTVQFMVADRANVLDLDDTMLTDDEKEKLQGDRYIVRDLRGDEEVSKVYNKQISQTLQNPSMSCYGNVLMTDGSFKRRLIVISPKGNSGWSSRFEDAIIVDVDGGRMVMTASKNIFVDNEGHNSEEWQKTFSKLPAPSSVSERQKVIFVNAKGEGTLPFIVWRRVTADGQTMLYGEYDSWPYANGSDGLNRSVLYPEYRGRHFNQSDAKGYLGACCPLESHTPCMIITNKPGQHVTQIGSDVFIPDGFKAIKLSNDMIASYKRDDTYHKDRIDNELKAVDDLASPQTLADIELRIFKSAGAKEIQPITDGIEWWIRESNILSKPMSKIAALQRLIVHWGLREATAQQLLKSARRNSAPSYIVKAAQPSSPGFTDPMITNDPALTTSPAVMYPQTDSLSANDETLDGQGAYMDMDATFRAQQAASQGQKEVLDTSVISGLAKVMDPAVVVDQYLGDLMLGLDRIGRILFLYYWHFDKFKERYGSQDMPELEDNLTNVFGSLGDLVLFLKEKTIEPDVSGASAEAELEQVL